jgi:hypothetical protein
MARKMSRTLVYERTRDDDQFLPLIISPENFRTVAGDAHVAPFVVANSMREVQPEINILVSPQQDRLYNMPSDAAPGWELPATEGKSE